MKVIVAGSRDVTQYGIVEQAIIDSGYCITELISGGARGVDRLGELYAKERDIPIKQFIPSWNNPDGTTNRAAGIIRNKKMAEYADALVAIWDGESRGTKNMIDEAKKKKLRVYVHMI